jgi:hypothetical protein
MEPPLDPVRSKITIGTPDALSSTSFLLTSFLQLMHQPINTHNKIPLTKINKILYVSAFGYILREFQNKGTNPKN